MGIIVVSGYYRSVGIVAQWVLSFSGYYCRSVGIIVRRVLSFMGIVVVGIVVQLSFSGYYCRSLGIIVV